MVNKDYILRIAELFGRHLAMILQLRKRNKQEEALIYIDELMYQSVGLTTGFVDSASEEMLLKMISPLGKLEVEKCLILAILLREEGGIYEELGQEKESYYRYLKSLRLFLEALLSNASLHETNLAAEVENLLGKLEAYELPLATRGVLFRYYEKCGEYAQAEDTLFELVEDETMEVEEREKLIEEGSAFYRRLEKKSDEDLQQGNLARDEIKDGLTQLKGMEDGGR